MKTCARLTAFVTMSALSAALAGPPEIVSSFDESDEGWSTDKDARAFRWESDGGNPGGFIAAEDIGTGEYWRFTAPPAYLGDLSAYYGKTLSYDLIQLGIVGDATGFDDVKIVGTGLTTLVYQFDEAPGGDWTPFRVEIVEGVGWRVGAAPATEQQIRDVLANVTALSIRGEYRVFADSAGLDNVRIGDACTADFNADGSVNFFDVSDFIGAYTSGDPAADLAPPLGELNFFDISAFISAFMGGC